MQQSSSQQQQPGQSSAKPFTLVFYYVPEDKDDLTIPNAYAIPKNVTDITLADIEKLFPLEGDFHFRFKYKYNTQSVWLDLNNKQCKVPKVDNKIIMKVSRKTAKNLMDQQAGVGSDPQNVSNGINQADQNIDSFFQAAPTNGHKNNANNGSYSAYNSNAGGGDLLNF